MLSVQHLSLCVSMLEYRTGYPLVWYGRRCKVMVFFGCEVSDIWGTLQVGLASDPPWFLLRSWEAPSQLAPTKLGMLHRHYEERSHMCIIFFQSNCGCQECLLGNNKSLHLFLLAKTMFTGRYFGHRVLGGSCYRLSNLPTFFGLGSTGAYRICPKYLGRQRSSYT